MPRLPWEKFWYSAWMADAGLRQCSLETRGAWIDTLCALWHDSIYFQTRTVAAWAKYWGCSVIRAEVVFRELRDNKVALVRVSHMNVTLTSRRLKRRYGAKLRQRARRASAPGSGERREERGEKERDGATAPGLLTPHQELAGGLRAAGLPEYIPRAGRMLNQDNGDARTVLACVLTAHKIASGDGMMGYAYRVLKGEGPSDEWLEAAKGWIERGAKWSG